MGCMYVCVYVCMDVCMHVCMCAWMYVCMHLIPQTELASEGVLAGKKKKAMLVNVRQIFWAVDTRFRCSPPSNSTYGMLRTSRTP